MTNVTILSIFHLHAQRKNRKVSKMKGTYILKILALLLLGGKASKNKLKDASFIFSMTNVTILSIFRLHAQRKNRKVSKMKGTYILKILALLLFENLQRIY